MDVLATVSTYFKTGGPFMYIILGVGVLALAMVLERLWVIGRASSLNGEKFAGDLERLIAKGEMNAAAGLCKKMNTPASRVALHVLASGAPSEEKLQMAADAAATLVLPPLARRLPHLTMLANVATLLGLLGTIFGLTTAFSAVGAADPTQRSAFLAAGISQALNTTSFGLIVAVPTLIAHGFLVSTVERVVEQVDEVSIRLTRVLCRRGGASAQSRAA